MTVWKTYLQALCIPRTQIKLICPPSSYPTVTFGVTKSLLVELSLPWTSFHHSKMEIGVGTYNKGGGFENHAQVQERASVRPSGEKDSEQIHSAYSPHLCPSLSTELSFLTAAHLPPTLPCAQTPAFLPSFLSKSSTIIWGFLWSHSTYNQRGFYYFFTLLKIKPIFYTHSLSSVPISLHSVHITPGSAFRLSADIWITCLAQSPFLLY